MYESPSPISEEDAVEGAPLWCAGFAPQPSWVAAQERKEPAVV